MAYKELGNVNDLVRDEILDANDFATDLNKMRELMQTMASLKADAERLKLNIKRLEDVDAAGTKVVSESRRFVVTSIAHAVRSLDEAEVEKLHNQRTVDLQLKKNDLALSRLARYSPGAGPASRRTRRGKTGPCHQRCGPAEVEAGAACPDPPRAVPARNGASCRRLRPIFSTVLANVDRLLTLNLSFGLPTLAAAAELLRPVFGRLLLSLERRHRRCAQGQPGPGAPHSGLQLRGLRCGRARPGGGAPRRRQLASPGHRHGAEPDGDQQKAFLRLLDEQNAYNGELRTLQAGMPPAPPDVRQAVDILLVEIPRSKPRLLAELVEPRKGTEWQPAIEGYLGRDRYTIIVEPGEEAACVRVLSRRLSHRTPKVAQGTKAMADAAGMTLAPDSILHELQYSHVVAKAYLIALYGRVKKARDEDELARMSQGLTVEGVAARAYGMSKSRMEDKNLAFGQESRERRRRYCEAELIRIRGERTGIVDLQKNLRLVAGWFSGPRLEVFAPLANSALDSQLQHDEARRVIAGLDTTSFELLEGQRKAFEAKLAASKEQSAEENQSIGALNVIPARGAEAHRRP